MRGVSGSQDRALQRRASVGPALSFCFRGSINAFDELRVSAPVPDVAQPAADVAPATGNVGVTSGYAANQELMCFPIKYRPCWAQCTGFPPLSSMGSKIATDPKLSRKKNFTEYPSSVTSLRSFLIGNSPTTVPSIFLVPGVQLAP